ncbi:MAG: outer membrane beta-barrel protein, partial [Sphingopyxis sp.]
MKKLILAPIALSAALIASPAFAQNEAAQPDIYAGIQGGYHDIGTPGAADDNGVIYGAYMGVDVPVSGSVFVGAEGNFSLGTSAIDYEYGVAARIGTEISPGTKLFVRGGYQEVDFDLRRFTGLPPVANADDTDGGYLVGAGADIAVSDRVGLRLA